MPNEPGSETPSASDSSYSILENEKQETLQEIEELVRAGRRPIGADGQLRRPGASGAGLPITVAAASLALMTAAAFLLPRLYDRDERRSVDPSAAGPAGGSELFRALREEAGEQIEAREKTIGELKTRYDRARSERETLRREFDARLAARAKELESGIAAELEAERRRLSSEGLTETIVAQRLKEFQERQEAERKTELEAFQARLEAETAERDRQLAAAAALYNQELKRSTDPLKAEIERLAAANLSGEESQQELARRYEEAAADSERAKKAYEERIAVLERRLRESESQASRLQVAENRREAARKRLDSLLAAARGSPTRAAPAGPGQQVLLDLLEAKADTRALLAEEPAKSSRPGLGERLDRYFEIFEGEYRSQGRKQGLAEASEAVDSLAAGRAARNLPAGDADFARFLEKLQTLLK